MSTGAAQGRDVSTQVLDAADRLFYARGFHAVSVDDIRDAAGVSLRALYAAFPSKADIVAAYLGRRDRRWRNTLSTYVQARSPDPREQLLLVFDGLAEFLAGPGPVQGCAFQRAFPEVAGSDEDAAGIVRAHKRHVRDVLVGIASAAGASTPEALGDQLMLVMEGALITAAISGDSRAAVDARDAARVLIDVHVPTGRSGAAARGRPARSN